VIVPPFAPGRAVSLEEAQAAVLAAARPLPPEVVPLAEALGTVLAEEVRAGDPVPPFACSAMDGYALASSSEQAPIERRVVRRILAGDPPGAALGAGEAVRIMTGAPLPPGADAVCMLEEAQPSADARRVVLLHAPERGEHVRRAGEDVTAGAVVMTPGVRLGPRHLGVLASVGVAALRVRRRPVVGVLSTGSELCPAPAPLGPGQIRDSNRYLLTALVRAAGAEPLDLGIVRDDEDVAAQVIADAGARCDLVLTSGGVSVGDRDVVKAVLERCCPHLAQELAVAIKPAKPLAFGVLASDTLLIGLPGNPVSSAVSFELFVRPALSRLQAETETGRSLVTARAAEALWRRPDGKLHLVHVALRSGATGELEARRAGGAASHLLASTLEAHGLAFVADGEGVAAGECVEVLPLSGSALGG
jgi:molybdenum cofactor synthesis domain-containing protein